MTKLTQKQIYLKAGLKLLPCGKINNYQYVKLVGRLGSCTDSTWKKTIRHLRKGFHTCCKSKREYYHKVGCKKVGGPDDLSDLK